MYGGDVQEGARVFVLGAAGADAAREFESIEVDEGEGGVGECYILDWVVRWAELFDESLSGAVNGRGHMTGCS